MSEDYYGNPYGIGGEERMEPFKPRVTPESSPDPIIKQVSPPAEQSGETAKRKRQAQPSKGDAYLWRTSQPNYVEVHRQAESHLPDVESDDETMEDVADIDDRIAEQMKKETSMEPRKLGHLLPQASSKEIGKEMNAEEDMADAESLAERQGGEGGFRPQHGTVADNVQRMAAYAFTATEALSRLGISSPHQQPTLADQVDIDRRKSSSTATTMTTATTAPSRKTSDGLGICIKLELPTPFTPITPIEPSFHNSDPFSAWSPLSGQHRGSMSAPGGEKYADSLPGPNSPEPIGSPRTLPPAKAMFDAADKYVEESHEQRPRHPSLSSLTISTLSHERYRASFSNAHPSPSMTSEPRSSLALSPPSGLRRESYPLASSVSPGSYTVIGSPPSVSDATSPHPLPTPQSPLSDHRHSIDERTLPPLPGVGRPSITSIATVPISGTAGYKCDFPGCTAPPFQTPYLLNSHANVHSTSRPHYCPVAGCPRSEGGRGFKRKNEMIRHGLVHDSPGYVCPFCPDREHKYPRPDNLQRHVRVHHTDKSREDPQLRDVLAQRPDLISTRGRRRRMIP